jgi:hypothetical protein
MRELLDHLSPRAVPTSTHNALGHIILALGIHALASETPPDKLTELRRDALAHFRASSMCKPKIHGNDFSVRDFQVSESEHSILFTQKKTNSDHLLQALVIMVRVSRAFPLHAVS